MKLDLHYDSDDRRPRAWLIVIFYVVLLTLVFGLGWLAQLREDRQQAPEPTRSTIVER